MRKIVVIAHDLRSIHNVGSLLRTAEGLGIEEVFLTGYSPYPKQVNDYRLPHQIEKINKQINKTALGAEKTIGKHENNVFELIKSLKQEGFVIVALEQATNAVKLSKFVPSEKTAILLGRELEGIDKDLLNISDVIIQIPMLGEKESFNVVQAAAMALYHLRFIN